LPIQSQTNGIGLAQYTQDYDESFPIGSVNDSFGNGVFQTGGWAAPVFPYLKSTQIYTCPDDPTTATAPQSSISYALNNSFMGDGNNNHACNLASLSSASLTVMLCEVQGFTEDLHVMPDASPGATMDSIYWSGHPSQGAGNAAHQYATGNPPGQTLNLIPSKTVHFDGANYLAADGHVKYLMPTKISGGKDNSDATAAQDTVNEKAAGTSSMNNGGGPNSAALTFSKK